ncbi:MAG: hypothetical protein GF331_13110 [Chitinivibrionales bacterium]|nr:hypothetical protein [Chitinivibrionales bacterium]
MYTNRIISSLAMAVLAGTIACAGNGDDNGAALSSDTQKFSYAIGLEIGASLQSIQESLDLEALIRGIRDTLGDRSVRLTAEESFEVRQRVFAQLHQEESAKNLREQNEFLARNARADGVISTSSGLQYKVITEGAGTRPTMADQVVVHYRGTLLDGTEFDSSYRRGEPSTFPLESVIDGWAEVLQVMQVGSTYRVWIPSHLAYGEEGAGQAIGPNELLIFDIKLLGVVGQ